MIRAGIATRLLAASANDSTRWTMIETSDRDISIATTFVQELTRPLRFADAVHIATAQRPGATSITTDRQQIIAARAIGIPAINPLEQST